MFNSTIFDVIIGLVSVFLAISLAASAITEAVSTALALRAGTLLKGIEQLLNDPGLTGLAHDVYGHALVNPLGNGKTAKGDKPAQTPSYIDSRHFAIALIDSIEASAAKAMDVERSIIKAVDSEPANQAPTLAQSIEKIPDDQIKSALAALYRRADGKAADFQKEVARWFDAAMDRVSGNYKRSTKWITFIIGLTAAVVLNADPVHVAEVIWQRPVVSAEVEKIVPPAAPDSSQAAAKATAFLQEIDSVGPLLGWTNQSLDAWSGVWGNATAGFSGGLDHRAWRIASLMLAGWLITAGATLFGAPFWFDILKGVVNLRGTGQPPASPAPAASPAVVVTNVTAGQSAGTSSS
jgi:hypothetical protein